MTWEAYYINMLGAIAAKSKDPDTQVGCIVVGPDKNILATGYNSFPRGIRDAVPERLVRPAKYDYIEHAERNCFYNAAREGVRLKGATLYIPFMTCHECARGVINVGIRRVVVDKRNHNDYMERRGRAWTKSFDIAKTLYEEAGVDLDFWEPAL